jgi:hypothetical protein
MRKEEGFTMRYERMRLANMRHENMRLGNNEI